MAELTARLVVRKVGQRKRTATSSPTAATRSTAGSAPTCPAPFTPGGLR